MNHYIYINEKFPLSLYNDTYINHYHWKYPYIYKKFESTKKKYLKYKL